MEIRMTQGADAEKPLISIIIPAYNAEPYLPGCIDSILKQSYQAYEILLLNDGSTDGTAQLGQQLMAEHTCIRFLSMENQGVSAARNRGIALARGQWLTFVDADDRIHPEMLSHLLQLAAETGSDIVGCDFVTWDEPTAEVCPQCGSTLFKKGGKNANLHCLKDGCGFSKPLEK